MDVVDIIKNTKTIYMSESSLETMMDIERVMDSLDMYYTTHPCESAHVEWINMLYDRIV